METRITQCPRCGTSFRVTDALLAVAAGAVRCGSCLHIFNAREHWLDDKKPDDKPAVSMPASHAAPIHTTEPDDDRREPTFDEDGLFDDDTALFDDEAATEETASRSIFNPSDTDFVAAEGEPEGNSRFDSGFLDASDWLTPNPINFGADNFSEGGTDGEEKPDESWVEDLLREDRPPQPVEPASTAHPAAELSDADRGIKRSSIISDYQLEHDDILAQVPETDESAPAEDTIILDLPAAYDPGLRRGSAPEPAPEEEAEPPASAAFSAGERIGDDGIPAPLRGLRPTPSIRPHQFVRERRWPAVLWGLGLIIVVAALPAQYLYFNFNTLARGELRPWLAQACGLIGCQLPPQSDSARIRTGSLIVRSHPSVSGALAVDAIITNLAPFAQPYPELVLQFTDIEGKPVAGRRFQPADYLGGELTGSHLMPVGQPVHIGLEVRDPGPRAVNYLLAVSPPPP